MADFYMHRMLIKKLQATIGETPESTIGAQGPDYFYYVLGKNKPKAMQLGNAIHKSHTRAFLCALLESAIRHDSEAMLHYLYGFLSHHALDTSIHPYIFYYTGLYQKNDPDTYKWAGLHLQFERKVDIAFIKHQLGILPHTHKLFQHTLPLKQLNNAIQTAIDEAVKETYGEVFAGVLFNQGYRMMRRVGRVLVYDPTGLKQKIIRTVESYKTPKNTYYQDLSHAQNTEDFDYLNLNRTPWLHPVTKASSTSTVLEMYDQAYDQSLKWIHAAKEGFQHKSSLPLRQMLTDASYDTGVSLNLDQTMQYFKDYRNDLYK